jgi:hypothetical protein
MKKLQKKYEEFVLNHEEYVKLRKELLSKHEEKADKLGEDIGIHTLRTEVTDLFEKKKKSAWRLYKKIWGGKPLSKDVDKFLAYADEILQCKELLSDDMEKVWQVSRDLIWSYGEIIKEE